MSTLGTPIPGQPYHLDDETECPSPDTCPRLIVWPGINRFSAGPHTMGE